MEEIKLKTQTLSLKEFYLTFLLITTFLDKKYAEILATIMINYPSKYIEEEVKVELRKILNVEDKNKAYQDQMISKSLTHLVNEGYLRKVQNGVYEINDYCKHIIRKSKGKNSIKLTFNFNINEF